MKKAILITFILGLTLIGFGCGGNNSGGGVNTPASQISDKEIFHNEIDTDHSAVTPKGIQVKAGKNIDPALLPLFDQGLADLFRIASDKKYGYRPCPGEAPCFTLHNSYTIYLFPRSPHCQDPAFLVDATGSPYEGSEWDKDPSPSRCLLCAAGMMA